MSGSSAVFVGAVCEGERMAERRYGGAGPSTRAEMWPDDWADRPLSGETHENVAFHDLDLTESDNDGGTFTECVFNRTRFNASRHAGAAFVNCTFSHCTFFDVTFEGCKLVGSFFDQGQFGLLTIAGGDWSFVGLPGADLRKSTITDVRMREVDLVGARLGGATLHRVDLSGAWLRQADLTKADLRGSDLSALDPLTTTIKGAIIDPDQAITVATALGLQVRPDLH